MFVDLWGESQIVTKIASLNYLEYNGVILTPSIHNKSKDLLVLHYLSPLLFTYIPQTLNPNVQLCVAHSTSLKLDGDFTCLQVLDDPATKSEKFIYIVKDPIHSGIQNVWYQ